MVFVSLVSVYVVEWLYFVLLCWFVLRQLDEVNRLWTVFVLAVKLVRVEFGGL